MDLITALRGFVRVVETGSFSAVAREANTSQSAVTRLVAQLEEHFGVRLLHRTTRRLSLTDEGQDLLTRARHLLEEAEALEDIFARDRAAAVGLVRIGLPVGSAMLLGPDLAAMVQSHPGLSVELVVDENVDDLVGQRLDLALRFSDSPDTSLVSRALATLGWAPVAAPAYLEAHGAPERPEDLLSHACLVHDLGPGGNRWVFEGPNGTEAVEVNGILRSNNSMVVRQAVLGGNGIAFLGEALVFNDIRSGRLYRLLPNYTARRRPAYVVYPSRRHLPLRTRVVIDFLVDRFKLLEQRLRDDRAYGENEARWLT